ncbi:MAG: hypothetical protein LBF58_08110, partial [Deltaproteobacteria bacterium]|nr:hypothetical protein [Deltaproteobacteria bacterium]
MAQSLPSLEYLDRMNAHSCQYDPRIPYFFYAPKDVFAPNGKEYNLVILVHGNERSAETYRNASRKFAEATDSIVLAPLFPAGLVDPGQIDNYNLLRYKDVHFDAALAHMADELRSRFPIKKEPFFLHGFSAGGQFVHRFFYLYPHLIRSISVGSCSQTTFLDPQNPWPAGIKDLTDRFGLSPNPGDYGKVNAQFVIGADDNFIFNPEIPFTRHQLLTKLRDDWAS